MVTGVTEQSRRRGGGGPRGRWGGGASSLRLRRRRSARLARTAACFSPAHPPAAIRLWHRAWRPARRGVASRKGAEARSSRVCERPARPLSPFPPATPLGAPCTCRQCRWPRAPHALRPGSRPAPRRAPLGAGRRGGRSRPQFASRQPRGGWRPASGKVRPGLHPVSEGPSSACVQTALLRLSVPDASAEPRWVLGEGGWGDPPAGKMGRVSQRLGTL